LLWRDHVIGWANVSVDGKRLVVTPGFASGRRPRDPAFSRAFDTELDRWAAFLDLPPHTT